MSLREASKLLTVLLAGTLLACGERPQTQETPTRVAVPSATEETAVEATEGAGDFAPRFEFDYSTAWAMVDEQTRLTGQPHTLIETAQGPLIVPYAEYEGMAVVGGDVVLGTADEVRTWRDTGPVRGVAFKNVWFTDGNVRWWSEQPAKDGLSAAGLSSVFDAGDFLNSRTPVSFTHVSDKSDANLEFKMKGLVNVPGGTTWFYWMSWTNPLISFSSDPSRGTVLHEMGHGLGFAHEFQRTDRDSFVDLSGCPTVDQFNYGKVTAAWKGTNTAQSLSPYDYGSVMNGYSCVVATGSNPVDTDSYRGTTNPESLHDINSLYRMYGDALGSTLTTQRFGHAVASGDFDDDGYPDMVTAANIEQSATGQRLIVLYFYRGVELEPGEDDVQFRWMPWFWYQLEATSSAANQVELATGDFNGDGIDDLATGMPWANDDQGKVKLLFVNQTPDSSATDEKRWAPWGRQGVRTVVELGAADYGLQGQVGLRLGASLAAGKLSRAADTRGDGHYDDLLIGAPGYASLISPKATSMIHGAVVHQKGANATRPNKANFSTSQVIKNSIGPDIGFGKSVATIANFCDDMTIEAKDGIVIGAPEGAAAFVYGSSSSSSGGLVQPTRLATLTGTAGSKFGRALDATSLRRRVNGVWTTKFYVAVGAPAYQDKGRVSLIDLGSTGAILSTRHFTPAAASVGDEFGYAVKAHQRSDAFSADPIDDLMVGIGAPGVQIDGNADAGKVYLWQPFNSDGSNQSTAIVREPANTGSGTRYGEALSSLGHRRNFEHGGFVVGAPYSRETFVTMTTNAGSTDLLLDGNTASFAWSTRRIHLNVSSAGDRRPN